MKDPHITYNNRYIETLWWLLKQLHKKELPYKGYTTQPYSPATETGLSSHELNQPGCYCGVKDTTVVGQFKMRNSKPKMTGWGILYFLTWATTLWTSSSNTALRISPKTDYATVQTYSGYMGEKMTMVLAKALLYTYFNKKTEGLALEDYKPEDKLIPFKIVGEYKGPELAGMEYKQLIPWVKPIDVDNEGNWSVSDKGFRVILGNYVATEDGTGIVHIVPTFDADDAFVARVAGIPSLFTISKRGETRPVVDLTDKFYLLDELDRKFVKECVNVDAYEEYQGCWVRNAYDLQSTVDGKYDEKAAQAVETFDIYVCMMVKTTNQVFKIERCVHNHPHCWRIDKPVLYYPLGSWFIHSAACKKHMIELNKAINWRPESTNTERLGKWLENLNDWNLSHPRYWGTPLPIWRTEDGDEEKCIESVKELYNGIERFVVVGLTSSDPYKEKGFQPGVYAQDSYDRIDLHHPYVDDITLVSKGGKPMRREPDLIDVWFDPDSMPYVQIYYPFEDKELFDSHQVYPVGFMAEDVDQTRSWFFTLYAIATMVFNSISYKAIISDGLVLDKNGNKMSKRLGNAVDPFSTIEKYGSDPLRWYMITNSSPWGNLEFDVDGVEKVRRRFFDTLYNTYSFFALCVNVDESECEEAGVPMIEHPEIDRWTLSVLNTLVRDMDNRYNEYELTRAGRLISDFVNDNLSNWYVRLNHKRFWDGGMTQNKLSAFQALHTCLETVIKLMAPIVPFYADMFYSDLTAATGRDNAVSVHLAKFPECREEIIDKELKARMQMAQNVASMVLALRRKVNIKMRQPLWCIMIPVVDEEQRAHIEAVKALIMNEVNIGETQFVDGVAGVLMKKVKCGFEKLGPKFSKQVKVVAAAVTRTSQEVIAELEKNGAYTLSLDGTEAVIRTSNVKVSSEDIPGWLVTNEGELTVALEVTVTGELRREGIARELVNRIQNIRKSSSFEVTDKIKIALSKNPQTDDTVGEHKDYICNQVLGTSLTLTDGVESSTELEFDDFKLYVSVIKE